MVWFSIHVHYHEPELDGLILDAVRPYFDEVGSAVETAYFIRHWRQGPHLRLHLRTDPETFDQVVHPAAREIVGGYLARRPSTTRLDPHRLLPLHQQLSLLERDDGPLLPWIPNNTLRTAAYERRLEVLGSVEAADLLADFLASTTGQAFQMTEHVRRGGQRLRLAFDLMIAVAHVSSGVGLSAGSASYRSHAEAFLTSGFAGSATREAWDRHYRAHRRELVGRVRDIVAQLDGGTVAVPFVAAWVEVLERYRARGRELIEAGRMSMDPPAPRGKAWNAPPLSERSPFHREFETSEWFARYVRHSSWFAAYRLALSYTYLHLTRLGVTPGQRFLLCHLAANAAEELYGVSAVDLVPQPSTPPRRGVR